MRFPFIFVKFSSYSTVHRAWRQAALLSARAGSIMQGACAGPLQCNVAPPLHPPNRTRRAMAVAGLCAFGMSAGMAYHARPASSRERLQQQPPLQLTSLRDFALAAVQLPAVASGRLGAAMGLGQLQQQRQHGHNTRASAAAAAHSGGAAAWVLAPSKGDGRCLFRSLAQGDHRIRHDGELLPADQETEAADLVRRQVCDRLQERRADLAPFIDEDFDAYVAAMRHPHTWGGEPELSVAADVLSRPVHVYDASLQPVTQYSPVGGGEAAQRQEVALLFQRAGHYDLLVQRNPQRARSKL